MPCCLTAMACWWSMLELGADECMRIFVGTTLKDEAALIKAQTPA